MEASIANIQDLSRTVLRSAQHDAKKILSEAEEKKNDLERIAQQEREDEYHQIIAAALKEANFIKNRNLSAAESEAHMTWLVNRESLINEVFEESIASLGRVIEFDNYQEIVEKMITEAIFQLNDTEVTICLDEKANQLISDSELKRIAKENDVVIMRGEVLENKFGVIAKTVDGHRQFDNTLRARLGRMKSSLRLNVFQILMGEA